MHLAPNNMAQGSKNVWISPIIIDDIAPVAASFHVRDLSQFTIRALKACLTLSVRYSAADRVPTF